MKHTLYNLSVSCSLSSPVFDITELIGDFEGIYIEFSEKYVLVNTWSIYYLRAKMKLQ